MRLYLFSLFIYLRDDIQLKQRSVKYYIPNGADSIETSNKNPSIIIALSFISTKPVAHVSIPLDRITKRPIKTQSSRGKVNSGKYMQTLVLSKIDEDPRDGVHERNHLLNWQTRKHQEVKYQTCIN